MNKEKFAVIQISGKQELVNVGDIIKVNRLNEAENKSFDITNVLLVKNGEKIDIGTPLVKGAKVKAQVVKHTKGPKVFKQTYTAKSRYRRKVGHRQALSEIKITGIDVKYSKL